MSRLTVTREAYEWSGLYGIGLASSSVASCAGAIRDMLHTGRIPKPNDEDLSEIASRALELERIGSDFDVAAQDVYTIVFGGIRCVYTAPKAIVKTERILMADPAFFDTHGFYCWCPSPERHKAPVTLSRLLSHARATDYVKTFSALSTEGAEAIEMSQIDRLIKVVSQYGDLYDEWAGVCRLSKLAQSLKKSMSANLRENFSLTPLGAGFADSFLFLGESPGETAAAARFAEESGWRMMQLQPVSGICLVINKNQLSASIPHRVDLIGAADLGTSEGLSVAGTCLSLAVAPTNHLTFEWEVDER